MMQTRAGEAKTSGNRETNAEAKRNRTGEGGATKTRARTERGSTQVSLLYDISKIYVCIEEI